MESLPFYIYVLIRTNKQTTAGHPLWPKAKTTTRTMATKRRKKEKGGENKTEIIPMIRSILFPSIQAITITHSWANY
jgi:hypothetical protein